MHNITQAITRFWNAASEFEQSGLAVLATIVCFYLVRYVIILRLEKLTRNTDNDFDDRLVHFVYAAQHRCQGRCP